MFVFRRRRRSSPDFESVFLVARLALQLRRIDSSKGTGYPLAGRNSLEGQVLKRTHRELSVWLDVACRLARQLSPKLMLVPRSNLSADPVYYGPRSPFADEWSTIFLRSFRYFTGLRQATQQLPITNSCFERPFVTCARLLASETGLYIERTPINARMTTVQLEI